MTADWLFVTGTGLTWLGVLFLLRSAVLAVRTWLGDGVGRAAWVSAGIGGACVLVAASLPLESGRPAAAFALPLAWLMMPFTGWVAVVCLIGAGVRGIQSVTALNAVERRDRLVRAGVWLLVAAGFGVWFSQTGGQIEVFRGRLPLSPLTAVGLVALLLASVAASRWLERRARLQGIGQKFVTHLALLAGCLLFGLPFAWLLLTSFKEPRDVTTTDGLVWVPRIQVTHPYLDPERPLVEANLSGRTVRAALERPRPDGRLVLTVERPYSLRGTVFVVSPDEVREIPREQPVVTAPYLGATVEGFVQRELDGGDRRIEILSPPELEGRTFVAPAGATEPVRKVGLRWQNYTEAFEWLPPETKSGLVFLQNTLVLVVMSVIGTVLSCSIVAYAFSRLRFPGKGALFGVMLATMMLPGAVTMLPTFLIFRGLGWIDTLYPLWVPAFFAGAFNVFLLRQFFRTIPMELEEAARIDGCSYLRTFWSVMLPQIKPALIAISIWTFMGAWNNFMGPLIYVSTPENMPIAYALQLFNAERGGDFGMMMACATMATLPVIVLFFFAQRYFVEGVQLSGLGGR